MSDRGRRGKLARAGYQARLVAAAAGVPVVLPTRIRPLAVSVRLSDRCNSRCLTCRCWALDDGPQLTTERALRLMDEIAAAGIPAVRFTGGEPLLRRDLFQILEAGKRAGLTRFVVATNGLLLERLADEVNASPITNLSVSLDGIGFRNDRIRGVPGDFDRVVKGLERVRSKVVKIVSTITGSLADDVEDLILFCRQRGYEYDVNLPHDAPYFFAGDEVAASVAKLWPSPAQVDRIADVLAHYGILNRHLLQYVRRYMKERHNGMRHCMHGYCFVGVEPDGSVNPGCYVMPAGSIHEATLTELLDSPAYAAAARRMYDLECRGCTCGYALSIMYERPLTNLGYVRRRLRRTPALEETS